MLANPLVSKLEFNPIYYDEENFCTLGKDKNKYVDQSLGQALFGDRLQYTPYKFKFGQDIGCEDVCTKTYKSMNDTIVLEKIIKNLYTQRWFGDNIPVVYCPADDNYNIIRQNCSTNFFAGCRINDDIPESAQKIQCSLGVFIFKLICIIKFRKMLKEWQFLIIYHLKLHI